MRVQSINYTNTNPVFSGKIKKTESGNSYEKSNKAKIIATGVGAGASLATAITISILSKSVKTGFAVCAIPMLESVGSCFLIGAIIDGIKNSRARDKADIIAAVQQNPQSNSSEQTAVKSA